MIDTYDSRFLITLGLSYSQVYYNLAMLQVSLLDLLKSNYKVEPSKSQGTLALILLPWGFKLLYGLCTDLLPLCGSRKKNYIIAGGLLQCLVGVVMGTKVAEDSLPLFMVGGGVLMLAFSLMDVTLDGLMVIQSRKDPKNGSEDLQAYGWVLAGAAGVIGYIVGGKMSDSGRSWECFFVTAALGVILALVGCTLNRDLESQEGDVVSMPACQRLKFIFTEIYKGLKVRELYGTFIYFMIMGTIPQFKEYMYYY